MTDTTEVAPQLVGKKVLWLEDDKFLSNIIAQKLAHEQALLFYAKEGETALQMAVEQKPDIILLDIMLPGIDGVEVLKRLKASDETKNIPVIMFSNLDDKSKVEESMKLGATDFFIKSAMTLDDIIRKIVKTPAQ